MDFLYFPENKLEYIPAVLFLLLFVFAAILTMKLIRRISDKELQKAKKLEEKLKLDQDYIDKQ